MPQSIKFIDTVIRSLKPSKKRVVYWCEGCPGFGIRITSAGTKSFIFKYKTKSQKDRWITIGKYPAFSIHKARKEYYELYEQVHDYGRDPVQESKDKKFDQPKKVTVKEFSEEYINLQHLKEISSVYEEERYFKMDILPVIGDKIIDTVTTDDIDEIQKRIITRAKHRKNATRGGRVAIKQAVGCAQRMFDLAIKKLSYVTDNPVDNLDFLGDSGSRDRVLDFKEIWLFWNNLQETRIPFVTAQAIRFELVTMQRSKEVRCMRYDAYKPDEDVWHMERVDTKNSKMHRVPMNNYARNIISEVSAYTGASEYVFGATKAGEPPKSLKKNLKPLGKTALPQAVRANLKALEIKNFKPHDLRRTGATWITAVGLPELYAQLMLNHSVSNKNVTNTVYIQYSYDFEKQRAAKVWEYVLDQIVNCKCVKDIPTLDELREQVKQSGLL